jgi:hypothetical protein
VSLEILNLVRDHQMGEHLELFLGNRLTVERLAVCSRADLVEAGFSEHEASKLVNTINTLQSTPTLSGSATVSLKKKKKRGGVRGFFRNRSRLPTAEDHVLEDSSASNSFSSSSSSSSSLPSEAARVSAEVSSISHKEEVAASLQKLLQRRPSHEFIVNAGILLRSSIIGTTLVGVDVHTMARG